MGGPMAHNLMKGGHKLWVHARRPEAMKTLVAAGATACASAAEVGKHADVIFLIVSDTPDVESVIFGESGIAKHARSGSVIVDMSTISPTATKVFAERLAKQGVDMLDAPVSGGETGAINATLSIMVGGKTKVFERVKPLLLDVGPKVTHVGGNGLALLNVDYRFPIRGAFGGTVFADLGNVWADWRDFDPGELEPGAGLGFRYLSPIGPLRLEVGWKLDREPGESSPVFFFSFGNPF